MSWSQYTANFTQHNPDFVVVYGHVAHVLTA
jgi:hypothetical protein